MLTTAEYLMVAPHQVLGGGSPPSTWWWFPTKYLVVVPHQVLGDVSHSRPRLGRELLTAASTPWQLPTTALLVARDWVVTHDCRYRLGSDVVVTHDDTPVLVEHPVLCTRVDLRGSIHGAPVRRGLDSRRRPWPSAVPGSPAVTAPPPLRPPPPRRYGRPLRSAAGAGHGPGPSCPRRGLARARPAARYNLHVGLLKCSELHVGLLKCVGLLNCRPRAC
jgi:hypothetical protein